MFKKVLIVINVFLILVCAIIAFNEVMYRQGYNEDFWFLVLIIFYTTLNIIYVGTTRISTDRDLNILDLWLLTKKTQLLTKKQELRARLNLPTDPPVSPTNPPSSPPVSPSS